MAPDDERRIITECMRSRLPLPAKIQDAPELELGLELYFGAFFDLSTCRPNSGMGLSPIPWSAIEEYACVYEFDPEQREDLLYLVRAMDQAYIKHYAARSKVKTATKPLGKRDGKFR